MVGQYQNENYSQNQEEPQSHQISYGHGSQGLFAPLDTEFVTRRSRFSGPQAGRGIVAMLENPRPRKIRERR